MMSKYITVEGTFQVRDGFLRIVMHPDICMYYRWLFTKSTWNTVKTSPPKHGAHINIFSPKIHKNLVLPKQVKALDGVKIKFLLDIEGNYGGFTKGFLNFWMDVKSLDLEKLGDILKIPKQKNFARFHLTIFNTKKLMKKITKPGVYAVLNIDGVWELIEVFQSPDTMLWYETDYPNNCVTEELKRYENVVKLVSL